MIKVLFAGSPGVAASLLRNLLDKQIKIVGVLTNPATAKGRHKELIPTPVATLATENQIPVFTPEHLDADCREKIKVLGADLLVCFAYGHIFGEKFLSLFKFGGINLHPSLLPKYRGCTPVPAAILNQDKETAFTVQKLALGMDEGNILAQKKIALTGNETSGSLLEACAKDGADLIAHIIEDISSNGNIAAGTVQSGAASYTQITSKEDTRIDWNKSAAKIEAQIRAYTPEPSCFTMEETGTLKILEAQELKGEALGNCQIDGGMENAVPGTVVAFDKKAGIIIKTGDGFLAVKKLQRQQKNVMDYKSFMNGAHGFIGSVLK